MSENATNSSANIIEVAINAFLYAKIRFIIFAANIYMSLAVIFSSVGIYRFTVYFVVFVVYTPSSVYAAD